MNPSLSRYRRELSSSRHSAELEQSIHLAFPASSAAPMSLYRGKTLLSCLGEQEQSKRAMRRIGIMLFLKIEYKSQLKELWGLTHLLRFFGQFQIQMFAQQLE